MYKYTLLPLLYFTINANLACEFWHIDSPGVLHVFRTECCVLTPYTSVLMWDLKQSVRFPEWGLSVLGEILLLPITVGQV